MTVGEFIRQHPAQAMDVMTSDGFQFITPKRSLALARDQPQAEKLLALEISYTSFSGGAWRILTVMPELAQDSELAMA